MSHMFFQLIFNVVISWHTLFSEQKKIIFFQLKSGFSFWISLFSLKDILSEMFMLCFGFRHITIFKM